MKCFLRALILTVLPSLFVAWAVADPGPLPRSAPEAQGVSSRQLLDFVAALDSEIEGVHSVMVVRHGRVLAEGWWTPFGPEHNHVLYSLSKSFASTAVGIAVAEGKLSIDDEVLRFFPEAAPEEPSINLKQMRVRDLLTMTTGHEDAPSAAADTVTPKSFLAAPVPHKPGTHFKYNTAATFMLSAIVQKQTGETLVDYLKPRLFKPLGISHPVWDTNAEGVALGGYGLRVRTEDIAKLGQLYLRHGEWDGRRLLGTEWVALATSRQVSNGSNPDSDWDQGYGFQFWQCRHGAYRGDGAFGQYCVVMPKQDTVVAITSGLGNMQAVLDILWNKLLPAFRDVPLPENEAAVDALNAKLGGLILPPVEGEPAGGVQVVGSAFTFPANDDRLEWLMLEPRAGGGLSLVTKVDGIEHRQPCGHKRWETGGTSADGEPAAASFGWATPKELVIKVCAYETPFVSTWRARFNDSETITLERESNVGFGPRKRAPLEGAAQK